jgi:hypothetical protein
MAGFSGSGGVRPSRAASLVAAVVGLGMLIAVGAFFAGGPIVGVGVFFLVWAVAVVAIIGYHVWNAFSPHGVDQTQFHFRAKHDAAHPEEPGDHT